MDLNKTSRFISLILRHRPDTIGISLDEQGLIPKSRLYVHLSGDEATATIVGSRHGRPVVYEVLANQMYHDGYEFFQSVNGVWLTKAVSVKYLKKLK